MEPFFLNKEENYVLILEEISFRPSNLQDFMYAHKFWRNHTAKKANF